MKRGRPLKYKTVEELQEAIDKYFDYCDNRMIQGYDNKTNEQFAYISPEPYTMAGLAYELDLSRKSLINYRRRGEFLHAIKRARRKVEADVERRMNDKNTFTPGLIFNAKNNFGWKDTKNIEKNIYHPKSFLDAIPKDNSNQEVDETSEEN